MWPASRQFRENGRRPPRGTGGIVGPGHGQGGEIPMKNVGEHLSKLWLIVRELGRIPEYQEEAERLYRQRRASGAHPATIVEREARPRPEGRRRRAAIAGLAALTVALYLVAPAAANAAAVH